ncbi:MAG: hypothetical protein JW928_05705, partial [Candidatus Aureabacteria bacterium]|nr:hypothetical protein [Candidatus Auribacterota bacterium]
MKHIKVRLFAPLVFLSFCCSLLASPAKIQVISQDSYFPVVTKSFQQAKESITVVMPYIQQLDEKGNVSKLLEELSKAVQRGVTVKVYLDLTSGKDILPGGYLYDLYHFFKKNEIFIFFDYPQVHVNHRLIIIDNTLIIGGSAAWSDAMKNNMETCFVIESEELALKISESISSMATVSDPMEKRNKNFAYVPSSFLKSNSTLQKIVQRNDEDSLDVYLVLVRDFDGSKVNTDYAKIFDGMNLSKRTKPDVIKRKVNDALEKLSQTYGAISINPSRNREMNIQIVQNPGESSVLLPKTYWDQGWHKELSLQAKALLLVTCDMISFQKNILDWKSSRSGLSETYGINSWIINSGIVDLCKNNILDIVHVEEDADNDDQTILWMKYSGLYDREEFYKKYQELAAVHGENIAGMARNYASIIYKKYDTTAIRYIIFLLKTY